MRKHVTPALPTALIADPDRGDALPPEGRDVAWTPYWVLMASRGEVTVTEVASEPAAAPSAPSEPDAPHADA